jgi:tRNA (guanine37-N1)-methyltransferase
MHGTLESPHYTKPDEWNGVEVPEVLRNGHHAEIEKWRRLEGLYLTYKNRKDLFEKLELTPDEWAYIIQREGQKRREMPEI